MLKKNPPKAPRQTTTKKQPPNARMTAIKIINRILKDGAYSNLVLNEMLPEAGLSDLDRRFVTELVYGTVKTLGTLDWILEHFVSRPLASLEPETRNILRLGVYQIYFLDRVPVSAAVNESVNLAKHFGHPGIVKFVNAVLRSSVRQKATLDWPEQAKAPLQHLALTAYHPEWLLRRWEQEFGLADTEKLCAFDNAPAPLTLRANTLVTTREELLEKLTADGFTAQASTWSPDGIVCTKIPSLKALFNKYYNGFYIQDESSMLAGRVLNPKPGSTVIDMCSAPGGKTTHMAVLMENRGQVRACDIYPHKLDLIKANAARLGLKNVYTFLQDGTQVRETWVGKADYVLVDAPCSGLGVLNRRAEARWTRTEADLAAFPPLQLQILETAVQYAKPDGQILYSTCTLEPAENHGLVARFLAAHPDWHLAGFKHPLTGETVTELQLLPQRDGVDGFYLALLARTAPAVETTKATDTAAAETTKAIDTAAAETAKATETAASETAGAAE